MQQSQRNSVSLAIGLMCIAAAFYGAGCGGDDTSRKENHAITSVASTDHFNKILKQSGGQLLVFDLYADWCAPCRILSPILEEIAREHRKKTAVYKINVDYLPEISRMFGVSGIPLVVFVKNGKAVHQLTGVHPKDTYVQAVLRFSGN